MSIQTKLFVAEFHMTDGRIIRTVMKQQPDITPTIIRDEIAPDTRIEVIELSDQIHGIINPITIDGEEVAILATKPITIDEYLKIVVSQGGTI